MKGDPSVFHIQSGLTLFFFFIPCQFSSLATSQHFPSGARSNMSHHLMVRHDVSGCRLWGKAESSFQRREAFLWKAGVLCPASDVKTSSSNKTTARLLQQHLSSFILHVSCCKLFWMISSTKLLHRYKKKGRTIQSLTLTKDIILH